MQHGIQSSDSPLEASVVLLKLSHLLPELSDHHLLLAYLLLEVGDLLLLLQPLLVESVDLLLLD